MNNNPNEMDGTGKLPDIAPQENEDLQATMVVNVNPSPDESAPAQEGEEKPESESSLSPVENTDEYLEDLWDDSDDDESGVDIEAELPDDASEDEDEEAAPAPAPVKKKKRRNAKKRRTMRLSMALIMTTLVFGISVTLSVLILMLGKDFVGMGKSDVMSVFIVESGATTAQIAEGLYKQEIIQVPSLFKLIAKLSGKEGSFQVGEHYLRPSMAYEAILDELTNVTIETDNKNETVSIMFPEGITLYAVAEKLEEYEVCEADDFIYEFNAASFNFLFDGMIDSDNMKFYKKEGFFFPDTYTFYVDSDPEEVCATIAYNFSQKFKSEYFLRMKELDMTLDEVITLASIIQAEVGDPLEMKKVSSVFHNRLNNPVTFPLLQSDATTNYVNNIIREHAVVLSEDICDAYDTYKGSGLPPGAINNPGLDAIIAALYPDDTDNYFFCSDALGQYYYAKTNAEHEANYARALEAGVKHEDGTAAAGDDNNEQ